jgi:hypothetical protein
MNGAQLRKTQGGSTWQMSGPPAYQGMSGQLRYTKDSAGNVEPGLVTRSNDRQAIFLGSDPN